MNRHPGKKQIIAHLLDPVKPGSGDIYLHLKECSECRALAKSLENILKSSDNSSIFPAENLENRIFSTWNEAGKTYSGFPARIKPLLKVMIRPAAYAAIVLAFLAAILIYNNYNTPIKTNAVSLYLVKNKGSIFYNNGQLLTENKEIKTGRITTEADSSATLGLESVFYINIAEKTELYINSSFIAKENKVYSFDFEIKAGNILAEWTDHNIKKSFVITTKYARIEALGTAFIINEKKDSSRIAVLDGSVRVTLTVNTSDKKEFILNKGDALICNSIHQKIRINPADEAVQFNKIFSNASQRNSSPVEGADIPKEIIEKNTTGITDNAAKTNTEDQTGNMENKNPAREHEAAKDELLKEKREFQKQIRRDIRQGKK